VSVPIRAIMGVRIVLGHSRLRFQRPQLHAGGLPYSGSNGGGLLRIRAAFGHSCQFTRPPKGSRSLPGPPKGSRLGFVADQSSAGGGVGAAAGCCFFLPAFLPASSPGFSSCGKNTALARPWLATAGSAGVWVTQPPPPGFDAVFCGAVSILLSPVVM